MELLRYKKVTATISLLKYWVIRIFKVWPFRARIISLCCQLLDYFSSHYSVQCHLDTFFSTGTYNITNVSVNVRIHRKVSNIVTRVTEGLNCILHNFNLFKWKVVTILDNTDLHTPNYKKCSYKHFLKEH